MAVGFRAERMAVERGCRPKDLAASVRQMLEDIPVMPDALAAGTPAERVRDLMPMVPHGQILMEVWRCGACGQRVEKKDRFCRRCGARLTEGTADTQEGQP